MCLGGHATEILSTASHTRCWFLLQVTALCTYGSWPDASDPRSSGSGGHPIRLIAIPEHCTYAQLVLLITRGLAPQVHATNGEAGSSGVAGGRWPSDVKPRIRLGYRLPSRPTVVVGVHDDQDVRLMWEESAEHSGGWGPGQRRIRHAGGQGLFVSVRAQGILLSQACYVTKLQQRCIKPARRHL